MRYENVRWLEISMKYVDTMKIYKAVEKLMNERLEYWLSQRLSQVRVMVN
jgi:hypothetical protein